MVLLGALAFAAAPARPAAAFDTSGKQVWAYYMGFWGGEPSWDMQANVLDDYPQIGKYDSRDPNVAATQIGQAKGAGIDAFLVSWFGLGDQLTTTPVLNNMLDRAAEQGFSVGAVVDIYDPNFNRDPSGLVDSLKYLVYDRANHPAYLRYNGKPVILFAFQDRLGLTTAQWLDVRSQVDPDHHTLWFAEGLSGCCIYGGAMDGMYAFNIAWNDGGAARYVAEKNSVLNAGGTMYLPTIHPGWDESKIAARDHRGNPTSPRARNGGAFLQSTWFGALASQPDVVLAVSWNEFMENSHIEPSVLYGSQSLDTLRPLIANWKASAAAPAAPGPAGVPTGSGATTYFMLNVRSGPGLTYAIIGQITPGHVYPITGQQGDWYQINYGGQTGYVFAPYTHVLPPGSF